MAERELPCIAGKDVQPDGDDAVNEDDDAEIAVVAALDQRGKRDERGEREPLDVAPGQPHARSSTGRPNRPSGFRLNARIMREKPRMSRIPV